MQQHAAALPSHRRGGAPLGRRSVTVTRQAVAGAPIALLAATAATARRLLLQQALQQAALVRWTT